MCSRQILQLDLSWRQKRLLINRNVVIQQIIKPSGRDPTFKSSLYCFFHVPGGCVCQAGPSPLTCEVYHHPLDCSGHPRSSVGQYCCHQGSSYNIITPHMSANRRSWETFSRRASPCFPPFLLEQTNFSEERDSNEAKCTPFTRTFSVSFFQLADWRPQGGNG